jgi:hypothetical protein
MNAPRPSTADTDRAAYTVEEFMTRVVPMSRAKFYAHVRAGSIKIVKAGHRTYVPADEGRNFINRLAAAAGE